MGAFRSLGALYRDGWRAEEDLRKFCEEWGIPIHRADLYVMRYEFDREREEKEELAKGWEAAFRKDKIDKTKFISELQALGMQDWAIDVRVKRIEALKKQEEVIK